MPQPRFATCRKRHCSRCPVLIVCEGGKTEPNYFRRLCVARGINSANVKVTPADGSDPVSVVTTARRLLREDGYDRIYCVFDRDGHANYQQALTTIAQSPEGISRKLIGITSVPCFEVWVLMHFVFSTAPFTAVGNTSSCDSVLRLLRTHIPRYAKGYPTTYDDLSEKLDQAVRHARQLENHNRNSGSNNPSTLVCRASIKVRIQRQSG